MADQAGIRSLTSQIGEDLSWLEEHARKQPDHDAQAARLRLAAAVVRNVVTPFLEGQSPLPLHVAVVGGAGAGKSTVSNMLVGAILAESNPQAGFTRHPIAYAGDLVANPMPSSLGFLGPLQRLSKPESASLDADVYQVRRVGVEPGTFSILDRYVVWDCPDMTAWGATNYIARLIEVCGLADVLVYVASDERYNDAVPTDFLKMLLEAGKTVVVCLVKMKPADAPAFVAHFQKEVLSRMPASSAVCLTIPQLTHEQLADPVRNASPHRIPLVNQVSVLGEPINLSRQRSVKAALHFLSSRQNELLGVARGDLQALEGWLNLVQEGQADFDGRYRREFLTAERFRRFDEAMVKLLDLLELPGVGKILSTALYVLRTPYRLLKGLFNRTMTRPEASAMPEKPVMEAALAGWLDHLRKEAARKSDTHPVWKHVNKGFASGLGDQARERFDQAFRGFQLSMTDEVDRTARSIYEDIEKNPAVLNSLRGTKFAIEVGSIIGTVAAGGINVFDLLLVPLASSVVHMLVELMGKSYVDSHREQARARQQAMVTQHVSGPMTEWLIQWPATGGSTYERLQTILRRFPTNLQQMEKHVAAAMK